MGHPRLVGWRNGLARSRAILFCKHERRGDRALALGNAIEQIEKFREADGGGVCALDEGVAGGAEGGDAEGHGDAVIAAGIDGSAVEGLAAGDVEAVVELGYFRPHRAKIFRDEGDAVGFLDTQLARAADANAAAGERRDGGEHGQLVNELSREGAADCSRSEALGRRGNLHDADQFGVLLFEIEDGDVRAECGEDVEQRGAGRVEADGVENEAGAGEERGGAEEECGGGQVARDGGVDGVERLRAGDGD